MSETNKEIVEKVNAAFAEGNTEGFLEHCTDDVKWTMVGEKANNSKAAIREWMKQMEGHTPPHFTVDTLIGEGDTVVCTGQMTMKEPEDCAGEYRYCDVYRFSGDKINELTSFVVMTTREGAGQESASA